MSKRAYPFLSGAKPNKPNTGQKCEVCGAPATHRAEFQYSWFRGDDEQTAVCQLHLDLARRDAKKFHKELWRVQGRIA